jgi:hypothetical protein
MEVRIGVVHTVKELIVDLDESADDVVTAIEAGLADGKPLVWLTDDKGRRIGVPADKLAYVEISDEDGHQRVGFGRS